MSFNPHAVRPREIHVITQEAFPDCAPKYVPIEAGSTAMEERRKTRRPELIAPRAAALYRFNELLPTLIDPGFLYKIDV